ncbi:conserved hypothetical protein, partial [Ricinus communis]
MVGLILEQQAIVALGAAAVVRHAGRQVVEGAGRVLDAFAVDHGVERALEHDGRQ